MEVNLLMKRQIYEIIIKKHDTSQTIIQFIAYRILTENRFIFHQQTRKTKTFVKLKTGLSKNQIHYDNS